MVNLHVAPGLGNGMGNLYTAGIAGTPLLVLVGGQDRRFLHTNPILWGPLEKMQRRLRRRIARVLRNRHVGDHRRLGNTDWVLCCGMRWQNDVSPAATAKYENVAHKSKTCATQRTAL